MLERAILIGLITPDQNKKQAEEYLEELAFLAKTAGAKPVKKILQKLNVPNNKTFLGKKFYGGQHIDRYCVFMLELK